MINKMGNIENLEDRHSFKNYSAGISDTDPDTAATK